MRIAIKIDNEVMTEAVRGVLNKDGEGYGDDLDRFGKPGWIRVDTSDAAGELPSVDEYETQEGLMVNFDDASFSETKPAGTDKSFARAEFLEGLEFIAESCAKRQVNYLEDDGSGYPVVADWSGRVNVGCSSFSKEEADAIMAHYQKWKDKLPKEGDESDSQTEGHYTFYLFRSGERLLMEISGNEIMAKYLAVIDRFRHKPLAKK